MNEQGGRIHVAIVVCCLFLMTSASALTVRGAVAADDVSAEEAEAVKPAQLTRPVDTGGEEAADTTETDTSEAEPPAAAEATDAAEDKTSIQVKRAKLTRKIEGQSAEEAGEVEADVADVEPAMQAEEAEMVPFPNVPNNLNKFLPVLKQALTIEIHYLRKICNPTDEQLAPIRAAGQKKIIELAKEFAKNEHSAFRNSDKGALDLLRDAILASAKQELDPQSYDRFSEELKLRHEASIEGACELMAINVDHYLAFDADKYDQMTKLIVTDAKPQWSRNLQTMFYTEYCPLPDVETLKPLLDTRREQIWKTKARSNSSISFGWPRNIGMHLLGQQLQFEELDEYDTESNTDNDSQ